MLKTLDANLRTVAAGVDHDLREHTRVKVAGLKGSLTASWADGDRMRRTAGSALPSEPQLWSQTFLGLRELERRFETFGSKVQVEVGKTSDAVGATRAALDGFSSALGLRVGALEAAHQAQPSPAPAPGPAHLLRPCPHARQRLASRAADCCCASRRSSRSADGEPLGRLAPRAGIGTSDAFPLLARPRSSGSGSRPGSFQDHTADSLVWTAPGGGSNPDDRTATDAWSNSG